MRPCTRPTRPGKSGAKRLVPLLDGGEIGRLAFFDHRTDPIDLGLARQSATNRRHDVLDALERHGSRIDRMAPRRLFRQPRDVEIAISGHHQGARDRGRAHQQGVGLATLGVQAEPLFDAESVLLVDDDESQIAELDIRLQ